MANRFIPFLAVPIALSIFICSCSSQTGSGAAQAAKTDNAAPVNAIGDAVPAMPGNSIKQVPKEFFDERITRPSPRESSGVEYGGYILDSYDLLYGALGPPSLEKVCKSLDIKMTPVYAGTGQEDSGSGSLSPSMVNVERGGVMLTFKAAGSKDDDYKSKSSPEGNVAYKVYKAGKEVSFRSVYSHHGTIYLSSQEELLAALGIKYYTDNAKGITYVGSNGPVDIEGRILARTEAELVPGKKSTLQLVYNYDPARMPNYRNIQLEILGPGNCFEKVFSVYDYGRSLYYEWGTVQVFHVNGDTLIQVSLSETPMDGNVDTVIYRYSGGGLATVFSKADYEPYLDGKLTLESDELGNCVFYDRVNGINRPVALKAERSSAAFNVDIRDERLEMDYSTGENVLAVRGSAIYKTNFFFLTMLYHYDKGRFRPEKALLTRSYFSFGLGNPLLFEYPLKDRDVISPGIIPVDAQVPDYELIEGVNEIRVYNLNDSANAWITMPLTSGWHAEEYVRDIASGFEFQSGKNRNIKKTYEFEIYKDTIGAPDYNFYMKGRLGQFNMLGYYRDQTERARFPNHCEVKGKVFEGKTCLGPGEIFILDCDLPKDERTQRHRTYEQVYAWIPIDGEALAYNLSLDVPLDEDSGKYVSIIKKMLAAK